MCSPAPARTTTAPPNANGVTCDNMFHPCPCRRSSAAMARPSVAWDGLRAIRRSGTSPATGTPTATARGSASAASVLLKRRGAPCAVTFAGLPPPLLRGLSPVAPILLEVALDLRHGWHVVLGSTNFNPASLGARKVSAWRYPTSTARVPRHRRGAPGGAPGRRVPAVHPGLGAAAGAHAPAAHRRHDPRHHLRRLVALPGAQGRPDGLRLDPGGGALDHPLPRPLASVRAPQARRSSRTTSCRRPARPASRSPSASASPCRRS